MLDSRSVRLEAAVIKDVSGCGADWLAIRSLLATRSFSYGLGEGWSRVSDFAPSELRLTSPWVLGESSGYGGFFRNYFGLWRRLVARSLWGGASTRAKLLYIST